MSAPVKLRTLQMAQFAARGFLRFDGVVPESINAQIIAELERALAPPHLPESATQEPMAIYQALLQHKALPFVAPHTPWQHAFPESLALGTLLRLPEVQGAIESLVGISAVVDHHFLHVTFPPKPGRRQSAQHYHQDSTIDVRRSFDMQLLYFPHAVSADMGGTRFLPGSHLRIVSESAIARYQNITGQQHVVCPAGTVLILHHGMWHGGGANSSTERRFMWKLRLSPREPQVRLWDTSDLPAEPAAQSPIFWSDPSAERDPVHAVLTEREPWFEADTERLEFVNRIQFWRRLLGDSSFDADYWMGRLESEFS